MATLAAVKNSADPYTSRERHHNEGHGRRLTAAFEAMEAFPMLAESRNRVLRLFETGEPSTADVVGAVEADVALAVTVLRLANRLDGKMRGRVESAVKGVEVLTPRNVHSIAVGRGRLTSSSAPPCGRACPSASACTPSPPSAPPTGSPASSATSPATG